MEFLLDALAVSRITRFVTRDRLGQVVRKPVISTAYAWANGIQGLTEADLAMSGHEWDERVLADDEAPALADFIMCPWCVGVWAAAAVVAARLVAPRVWTPVARALAASQIAGFVAAV